MTTRHSPSHFDCHGSWITIDMEVTNLAYDDLGENIGCKNRLQTTNLATNLFVKKD